MTFFGKKHKKIELHGWMFALEQCVRQSLEVYSGDAVRFEYFDAELVYWWGHQEWPCQREGGFRRAKLKAVVVGRQLEDGTPQRVDAVIGTEKLASDDLWNPKWNEFDLQLRKCSMERPTNFCSRYWASFDEVEARKSGQVVPLVRVHRQVFDDYGPAKEDTEYRIGHHLGDRRLEPISSGPRWQFGDFIIG